MTKKERYEYRKKMGICPLCGKNKPETGRIVCPECLNHYQQNRDYNRAHNFCVKCGANKVAPSRKYCDKCLEWRRERYKKVSNIQEYAKVEKLYRDRHAERYKANGMCIWCGKPVFENHLLCYEHLVAKRNYMRRRRALEKECKEN